MARALHRKSAAVPVAARPRRPTTPIAKETANALDHRYHPADPLGPRILRLPRRRLADPPPADHRRDRGDRPPDPGATTALSRRPGRAGKGSAHGSGPTGWPRRPFQWGSFTG